MIWNRNQKTRHRSSRRTRLEQLENRTLLIGDSVVVINEIMYNPADQDESLEWVELFNQHAVDIDLSGWQLDGAIQFDFEEGTVIEGRDYLVVAADPAALNSATEFSNAMGPMTGQLGNRGDQIQLLDNSNRIMNSVDYGDRGNWPVGADGSGASLAKRAQMNSSELPENWTHSTFVNGTPGAENFPGSNGGPPPPVAVNLLSPGDNVRMLVPLAANELPAQWNEPSFNDATDPNFFTTTTGAGFDTQGTSEVSPLIDAGGDIQAEMWGVNSSAFLRSTFNVANPATASDLKLGLDFNDGYIAYLNGTEIGRRNTPSTLAWNSNADVPAGGISMNLASDITSNSSVNASGSSVGSVLQTWDVSADYSTTSNPAPPISGGIWSYGYLSYGVGGQPDAASFTLYQENGDVVGKPVQAWQDVAAPSVDTMGAVSYNDTSTLQTHWQINWNPTEVDLVPDQGGSVVSTVRFQVPTSGAYSVLAEFADNQGAGGREGDAWVLTDSSVLHHTPHLPANTNGAVSGRVFVTYDQTINLNAGDSIYFASGKGSAGGDHVLLRAVVEGEGGGGGGGGGGNFDSTIAGAAPLTNWNNVPLAQQTNMSLMDSQGNPIAGLTLSTPQKFRFPSSAWDANEEVAFTRPGDTALMTGSYFTAGGGLDISFTGTIPYDVFDIYVYYNMNFLQNTHTFSIHDASGGDLGLSLSALEKPGLDTAFVMANAAGSNNANYVVFEDLTSADVPTNFMIRGSGNPLNSMNGIQIVDVSGTANVPDLNYAEIDLSDQINLLVAGDNVLAIQGLNTSNSDSNFLLRPELDIKLPQAELSEAVLVINEVAAATAETFWLEIVNLGQESVDLTGYVVAGSASSTSYTFPAQILQGGDYLSVTESELGFAPADGERIFLYAPGEIQLLDARRVTGRLRGRSPQHEGRWLYPDTATPAATNSFTFQEDIVINEIMFHHQPDLTNTSAQEGEANSSSVTMLVPMDDDWRYNPTGQDLGSDWAQTFHMTDGTNWLYGPAPLGFEPDTIPLPIATTFDSPTSNDPYITTYYFEQNFNFSGNVDDFAELELKHLIDDGAVFYLNGTEIHRHNMEGSPGDPVSASTLANVVVTESEFTTVTLPMTGLQKGTNFFNIEVHQSANTSSDVVMAVELKAVDESDPNPPSPPPPAPQSSGIQFSKNNEEWIEFYNRGTAPVDLTGWTIRDAVSFDFPAGTTMDPGEYLVVANDATALQTKYPLITILGDFSGILSNDNDNILLRDPFDNPADEVHYFDSGRWGDFADGGGSSLELRDPDSNNAIAEAWGNSDESDKSQWVTHASRRTAQSFQGSFRSPIGGPVPPVQFNDFVFGFLDEGQVLLDDISVIRDPNGAAVELMQNGSFEGDTIGGEAYRWRVGGNHDGTVVVDPEDPNNQVLLLDGRGSLGYVSNSAETTFKNNERISIGQEYHVSFRAKWIAGSRQLNNRAFFTQIAETTLLSGTENAGTPGAQNSRFESNHGPTFSGMKHSPTVPDPNQIVQVSVFADDPDGVASVTLHWSTGDEFTSIGMASGPGGLYSANIPGQTTGTVTQFYVEAVDNQGATTTFPAEGAASRAMYEVNDNQANAALARGADSLRLIMKMNEASFMHNNYNVMSDDFVEGTLIVNESEVYYNVGIRLRGSQHSRSTSARVGFVIRTEPDQLFRGVHRRFTIDRSVRGGGPSPGPAEIITRQFINHAGDIPSEYGDIIQVIAPLSTFNSPALLRLAEFGGVYLDSQFPDGDQNPLFELEMIFTSPSGDPNANKSHGGGPFYDYDLENIGDDKELYRFHLHIKNNRAKDDYSRIIEMNKAMGIPAGANFDATIAEVIDVDQWMRAFATKSLTMDFDGYGSVIYRHNQNVMFYVRPTDQKVIALPWDIDGQFAFNANAGNPIYPNQGTTNLTKLIERPANYRLYLGHLNDMVNTTWNSAYMGRWLTHFSQLAGQGLSGVLGSIQARGNFVQSKMPAQVAFNVTTANLHSAANTANIEGTGWINVKQIRLAGHSEPLDVSWKKGTGASFANTWDITLPVSAGNNSFTFEAYDYQGDRIGTSSTVVTSSTPNPVTDSLRITEINYNPADPTVGELAILPELNNDDFEFIEVQNIGNGTINLLNTRFTDGIDFTFPAVKLNAGQRGVIVRDSAAFQLRYGVGLNVLGEFTSGSLSNAGERLTLVDSTLQTVLDFAYGDSDPWPARADGSGATLEIIDAASTSAAEYAKHYHWRGSTDGLGSPAAAGSAAVGVVINEVLAHTDLPVSESDSIELFNPTASTINIGQWWISDSDANLFKFQIPAGTMLSPGGYLVFDESDFNPTPATPGPNDFALSGLRGDDVYLVTGNSTDGVTSFIDDVHFDATPNGESFGRVPNGNGRLAPMQNMTLGAANSAVRVGAVVISEINYNPESPSAAALALHPTIDSSDLEFVEILNKNNSPVDLTNWRLRGGIDFDFPAGTTLDAGGVLVITSFNPDSVANTSRSSAFRTHYGINGNIRLIGGYAQQLDNDDELVKLQRPDAPPLEDPTFIPRLQEDALLYDDLAPWPTSPDSTGTTLQRSAPNHWASDSTSWLAAVASPGSFGGSLPGDFNGDRIVNDVDIDLLFAAVHSGSTDEQFDLDASGAVDTADVTHLVETIMGIRFGDTDTDGDVDTGDLTRSIINFNSAGGSGKSWSQGDMDGDGDVDSSDLTQSIINFTGAKLSAQVSQAAVLTRSTRNITLEQSDHDVGAGSSAESASSNAPSSQPIHESVARSESSHERRRDASLKNLDDSIGPLGP